MRFSYLKLVELANLSSDIDVQAVAKAINNLGFEVESITPFSQVQGLKVGLVLTTEPNSASKNLTICKVQFDDKERTIQTAANNMVPNAKVIAFVPGAVANGVTFGPRLMQGVVSEGMLASINELGVSADLARPEHAGILLLPEDTPLTFDVSAWLGLNDWIIDVTILTNRADANAYYAMALELAAYFQTKVTLPEAKPGAFKSVLKVTTGAAKSLAFLEGKVDFAISLPEQFLLAKSQLKAINNLVDLTNLVLIMTGQPAHAYDAQVVRGPFNATHVSGAYNIFGNKEVALNNNLVIKSGPEVVSIAGVIGLAKHGVTNQTREFIIELGRFSMRDVRLSAQAIKLATAASGQSSRDFSSALTYWAAAYIGSKVTHVSELINAPELVSQTIEFNKKNISDIIGDEHFFERDLWVKVQKSLTILGYIFKGAKVSVPPHILHINNAQDLAEEIMRFSGYDLLTPEPPRLWAAPTSSQMHWNTKLVASGYNEVITYSLVSAAEAQFNPLGWAKTISLQTFVSSEHTHVRNSVAPSLWNVLNYQVKRKLGNNSFFELAYVNDNKPVLALVSNVKDLVTMQQDLQNATGLALDFERVENHDAHFHPGFSAWITYQNVRCGWIAKPHPQLGYIDAFAAELQVPLAKPNALEAFNHEQLITRDITLKLALKESISAHKLAIVNIDGIFNVHVIDEAEINAKRHVTLRISGSAEAISEIDKLYN